MKYLPKTVIVAISVLFTKNLAAQSDTVHFFSKAQIVEKLENLSKFEISYTYYDWLCCLYSISYICPKCGKQTHYYRNWLWSFGKEEFTWNNRGYFEPKLFEMDEKALEYVNQEIRCCREEILKIKGIHVALDESEFCKHCSPDIKNPTLYLLTNINGTPTTTKTPNIYCSDIQLLRKFLNNNTNTSVTDSDTKGYIRQIDEGFNRTEALDRIKKYERIKELLGIKEDELIEKED